MLPSSGKKRSGMLESEHYLVHKVERLPAPVTGAFRTIRHEFHCQLLSKEPLVIGRKSWIQCETLLAADRGRQPNTSKHSTQNQDKVRKEFSY